MSEHIHELIREWNTGTTVIINRCVHCGDHFSDGEAIEIKDAELAQLRAALQRALDETDYCYVCGNHARCHSADCVMGINESEESK